MAAAGQASAWVIDATDGDFESAVIEHSKRVPVVVDFWAPWCGPCRTLGPLLERLADEHAGKFVLARVNIDENPGLAAAFRIQSIPMVIGLRDGAVIDQFIGALPESGVRDFLARVLPSAGEELAAQGAELLADGRIAEAEAVLRRAVELDPRADAALVGLARVLAERGDDVEALSLLDRVGPGPRRQEADRLAAALRIRQSGAGDEAAVRARVEANPDDLDARFTLAQLLAAGGKHGEALDQYLGIVQRDRHFRDDGARKAMLDIFDLLGPGSDLADRYRSELAKVLFR